MTPRKEPKAKAFAIQMDEKSFSKYFKAFSDRSRLRILVLLSGGEMNVNEITDSVGLSQPTVSRHLAILRDAEVVSDRRSGQRVFYSLVKSKVKACCLTAPASILTYGPRMRDTTNTRQLMGGKDEQFRSDSRIEGLREYH